ncbi:hypothetical protein HY992_05635 [Candidatus Micrarchaeota archaeon]|nr:hypothetical protein [Candidatus Micrarchaeota archaeon]
MAKAGEGYCLFERLKAEQPQIRVHLMTKEFKEYKWTHESRMEQAGVTEQDISDKKDIYGKLSELVEKARAA